MSPNFNGSTHHFYRLSRVGSRVATYFDGSSLRAPQCYCSSDLVHRLLAFLFSAHLAMVSAWVFVVVVDRGFLNQDLLLLWLLDMIIHFVWIPGLGALHQLFVINDANNQL